MEAVSLSNALTAVRAHVRVRPAHVLALYFQSIPIHQRVVQAAMLAHQKEQFPADSERNVGPLTMEVCATASACDTYPALRGVLNRIT